MSQKAHQTSVKLKVTENIADSKRAQSRGEAAPTVNVVNLNRAGIVECAAAAAIAMFEEQNKVTCAGMLLLFKCSRR